LREPGFSGFVPAAERAGVGRVGGHVELQQAPPRHAEIHGSPAAVHQAPDRDHARAPGGHGVHDLARGASGRDHVLDHDHGLARLENEPAAEGHGAVLALGEEPGAAEGAGHLVRDEDAPEGGGHHGARCLPGEERPQPPGELGPEPRGEGGVHEDARALQVARRVQARGEEEVALEKSVPLLEEAQQGVVGEGFGCGHGENAIAVGPRGGRRLTWPRGPAAILPRWSRSRPS
jgi:hypothetical protein